MNYSYDEAKIDEKFELFRQLSPEARKELSDMVSRFETKEGNSLFQQGAPGLGIYLLFEGEVKKRHITSQGKELVFELAGPGSILGLETLFNKENHIDTVEVISEEARVGFLERNNFFDFMESNPSLLFGFAKRLSTKAMVYKLKLVEASYLGSKYRISRLILAGADSGLSLSRKKLARLTGVSYKTAIQVLGELESRDLIETTEHEIKVDDRKELEDLTDRLPLDLGEEIL